VVNHTEAVYNQLVVKTEWTTVIILVYSCKLLVYVCTEVGDGSTQPKRVAVIVDFRSLKAELNPICHLLTLLTAHHILHVSRIKVNEQVFCSTVSLFMDKIYNILD
jgi:hypothetical protein